MANLLQKRILPVTIALLLSCGFFISGNLALAEGTVYTKLYVNGTLLRNSQNRIFVVINGFKHPILNLTELSWYVGKPIIDVSDNVLLSYKDETGTRAKLFVDGSLLKSVSSGQIFLIVNGAKHHVINLSELATYKSKRVITVTDEVLLAYPGESNNQPYPNGSLLMSFDGDIFLITNGRKYRIKNVSELSAYAGRKTIRVSGDVLNHYETTLSI